VRRRVIMIGLALFGCAKSPPTHQIRVVPTPSAPIAIIAEPAAPPVPVKRCDPRRDGTPFAEEIEIRDPTYGDPPKPERRAIEANVTSPAARNRALARGEKVQKLGEIIGAVFRPIWVPDRAGPDLEDTGRTTDATFVGPAPAGDDEGLAFDIHLVVTDKGFGMMQVHVSRWDVRGRVIVRASDWSLFSADLAGTMKHISLTHHVGAGAMRAVPRAAARAANFDMRGATTSRLTFTIARACP
jgi:hypothetical protein